MKGREPTSRGRYPPSLELWRTRRRTSPCIKHAILPNEPTVLADEISRIMHVVNYLYRLQRVFAGGFVLENEPTGRVFSEVRIPRSVHESRRSQVECVPKSGAARRQSAVATRGKVREQRWEERGRKTCVSAKRMHLEGGLWCEDRLAVHRER